MPDLPRGTVTFLFTDLEGSTRLWRDFPVAMPTAYTRHDAILRAAVKRYDGIVYKVIGDAFQVAFSTAPAALAAALEAQRALVAESWEDGGLPEPLRVRMALHAGAVDPDPDGDYRSPVLNRLGRLLSAGHGGQVLLSAVAQELVRETLPNDVALRDLGLHRLKDLQEPSRISQLMHPDLPERFPPLVTLDGCPHNLPLQPTTFLGREDEVAAVSSLLRQEASRLVTLTGPGGTGKTRLSLQTASELLDDFADGAWFVELAPLSDPALVPSAIAGALGVREDAGRNLSEALRDFLRDKCLLLVLDNFEHVLTAAPLVGELLSASPGLKVLASSRSPLRLRGERELAVPPLGVPDPYRRESLDQLTQYEAVRLFIARAQDVKADFSVDSANAPAVAEICYRLDGLPLAIELAAARIKLLSPEALLRRLEQRLPLLTSQARDVPERQRTLRAAIAWSYDLLSSEEQILFRHLAVFAGGFTLEAVAAVTASNDEFDLYEHLTSLLDKSLIRSKDRLGEPRFTILETIREFGLEMLQASGEKEATARRHAWIYRDLAELAEPALLSGNDAVRWLAELDTEYENVRAALDWSSAQEPTTAVRLAGALSRFWMARGYLSEGRTRLESVMAMAVDDPPTVAKVLDGAGRIAWVQGDYTRSVVLHEQSLDYWRTTHDQVGLGWAEVSLADALAQAENEARAIALYETALQRFRARHEDQGISIVLNNLGVCVQHQGDLERAAALYEEALAINQHLGDKTSMAVALGNLGDIALAREHVVDATARFRGSLSLAWELRDSVISLQGLVGCGRVAVHTGDVRWGAYLLAAAEAQSESLGVPLQQGEQAGFDTAVTNAMIALGPDEGQCVWQAGRDAEFSSVVLAELSSNRKTVTDLICLGAQNISPSLQGLPKYVSRSEK